MRLFIIIIIILLFFYGETPGGSKIEKGKYRLCGSAPYSGQSSSLKPLLLLL